MRQGSATGFALYNVLTISMLSSATLRSIALIALLGAAALDAAALSLGRARGAVLVGRPLDVAIQTTVEPGEGGELCAEADLFHGDLRVPAPTVRWESAGNGQGVLRVRSAVPVDEPMVTIYLRAGCRNSSSRRYVLLAELPPEEEPARPAPVVPTVPRAEGATRPGPGPAVAASPSGPAPGAPAAATPRSARPTRADPAAAAPRPVARAPRVMEDPVRPQRRAAGASAREPRGAAQARLRLEPLDLSIDRDPVLRLSSDLTLPAATDSGARQAAGALWQALNKTPDESAQEGLRLKSLERDIQSLRDVTRQNATTLESMKAQLESARTERNQIAAIGAALALLLLAAVAWLVFTLRRAREERGENRWFDGTRFDPADSDLASAKVPLVPEPPPSGQAPLPSMDQTVVIPAAAPARSSSPESFWPAAERGNDFQVSQNTSLRMVGVEELIDMQDKADFFVSIGQPEQAIAILETHIHDQVETSALVWLDLLQLYHQTSRRVDYDRLRGEFRRHFTADVPMFDEFDQPSVGLEHYERALSRIVALWPSRAVLDVIEESLFRKPGQGDDAFSLEAYRELMLLYHIVSEVAPEDGDAGFRSTRFPHTKLQPLSAKALSGLGDEEDDTFVIEPGGEEMLLIPPSSSRLGLDIDLGAIGDEKPRDLPPMELDFDTGFFDDVPPKDSKH